MSHHANDQATAWTEAPEIDREHVADQVARLGLARMLQLDEILRAGLADALDQLAGMAAAGERGGVIRAAHLLKGMAANAGMVRLSRQAAAVERAGLAADDRLNELRAGLTRSFEALVAVQRELAAERG